VKAAGYIYLPKNCIQGLESLIFKMEEIRNRAIFDDRC
jgi:hypothetical protein